MQFSRRVSERRHDNGNALTTKSFHVSMKMLACRCRTVAPESHVKTTCLVAYAYSLLRILLSLVLFSSFTTCNFLSHTFHYTLIRGPDSPNEPSFHIPCPLGVWCQAAAPIYTLKLRQSWNLKVTQRVYIFQIVFVVNSGPASATSIPVKTFLLTRKILRRNWSENAANTIKSLWMSTELSNAFHLVCTLYSKAA